MCNFEDRELSKKEENCHNYGIGAFIIIAIVVITTITKSFWYVSYNEYALRKNSYNGVDITKTYEEGRYFLTLDNSLVYFPSTLQEVSFQSSIFAENGLEFDLDITFYYKLPKNKVGKIYNKYSTNYHSRITNNAKQVTKNIASTFPVDYFLQNKSYIEKTIANELELDLSNTIGVIVPKTFFKIIKISFPETLISKSLDTAIALQNNEIEQHKQEVDIIKADTSKLKAIIDAETSRTIEYANNEASLLVANGKSQAIQILIKARSDGINKVCNFVNITDSEEKKRLITIFAVMDNQHNVTMFNQIKNTLIEIS